MSGKIAYIASRMKQAERAKDEVLELLAKRKLETWDFTQDEIQKAWELVDLLMMIDADVSVGAALSRAVERVEAAELVMNRRDEMEQLNIPYDDMTAMRSLEEI